MRGTCKRSQILARCDCSTPHHVRLTPLKGGEKTSSFSVRIASDKDCEVVRESMSSAGCGRVERAPGGVCVRRYLRPVSGCINAGCAAGAAVATAGFGLLTFVLLLANSSRIVCGMSGSNRTPCCEQPRAVRRSDIMTMKGCRLRPPDTASVGAVNARNGINKRILHLDF